MAEPDNFRHEEQLAARRILAVTEEELQRIVLDLHDGPVQQLFAAQSQIRSLEARATQGEEISAAEYRHTMQRLSQLLGAALGEVRHFLGDFRPPDFARRDLVGILRGLVLHHEMTTGLEIDFVVPSTAVSVSLPVKIALYRICQEALSNAYRHANADQQQVVLQVENGRLLLRIADNGRGFVPPPLRGPDATEREEHIGLRGMRERIDLVNGEFALHSQPGQGTSIVVKVPLDV